MNKMVKLFLASVFVASTAVAGQLKIDQDNGIDQATGANDLNVEFQLDLVNSAIFKVIHQHMKDGHLSASVVPAAGADQGFVYLGRVLKVAPSAAASDSCDSTIMVDPGHSSDSLGGVSTAIAFSAARLNALAASPGVDADTSVDLSAITTATASCVIHVAGAEKFMDLSIPLLSVYAVSGTPMNVAVSIANDVTNGFDQLGISALGTLTVPHDDLVGAAGIVDQIKLRAKVVGAGAKATYNATVYYDVSQE